MKLLVKRFAKKSRLSEAKAADEVDRVVHDIIQKLRKGETASIPGVGKLAAGRQMKFHPERSRGDQ